MNRSQAVCRYYASGGTCFYGNECQFIHDNPEQPKPTGNDGASAMLQQQQQQQEDVLYSGYELPAESKLSSYIPYDILASGIPQRAACQLTAISSPQLQFQYFRAPGFGQEVNFNQVFSQARVPKESTMTNSLSNLTLQDVTAQEFIPANRGTSSSLNNVSTQPMPPLLAQGYGKGSPHMLRDRDSPDGSPVIVKRSFHMRNPSPLTVNNGGGDFTGMYQESLGGTTYFYQPHEENGSAPPELLVVGGAQVAPENEVIPPSYHSYIGPASHVETLKPRPHAPSFFMTDEVRMDLLTRSNIANSRPNLDACSDLPQQVDNYGSLCPLDCQVKSSCYGLQTTVYKATNLKSGLVCCLRRVHNFRLSSNKAIIETIDHWKKIQHSNLVQLRELFTTKAFGDNSVVFVYDYFPGAQTLKQVYFSNVPNINQPPVVYNGVMNGTKNRGVGSRLQQQDSSLRQSLGLLPESLIWTYIVQMSSALRTVHGANMAMRCIDPSKVLLTAANRARLRLNCAAVVDLITMESQPQQQRNMTQHHQKEDLISLGRVILCLACNTPSAFQFLESSMDCISKNYSTDLRNLLMVLLGHQPRPISINDVMPMIGARFYTQLDSAQMRSDVLEAELAKEMENGRLLRLMVKLGSINERPELNMDTTWSETGDRYMMKLFRDYLFHQCTKDGAPWLDMAHVIQCLNKLDAGIDERICLVSRDEQNVLVVSYAELKRCIEASFSEIYAKPHSA